MWEGLDFLIPSTLFVEGRTYRQPEVVFISLPQAATGLRCACRARSVGGAFSRTNFRSWIAPFHGDQPVRLGALSEGHFMQTCLCRRRHSYAESVSTSVELVHQL